MMQQGVQPLTPLYKEEKDNISELNIGVDGINVGLYSQSICLAVNHLDNAAPAV